MAYNFKKINELPVVGEMNDDLQLLVQDNGKMAKIAAKDIIPADHVTSWNDLTDKPSNLILAPAVAEVGQTLVVKAVDENGKPTEWEAVDVGGVSFIHMGADDGNFYVGKMSNGDNIRLTAEMFIEMFEKGVIRNDEGSYGVSTVIGYCINDPYVEFYIGADGP